MRKLFLCLPFALLFLLLGTMGLACPFDPDCPGDDVQAVYQDESNHLLICYSCGKDWEEPHYAAGDCTRGDCAA